jgi:hypothetical protein
LTPRLDAGEHGWADYNHRVPEAFFVEGRDIGRIDVLARLAGEVGLDEHEYRQALQTRRYRQAHQVVLRHAGLDEGIDEGITAVPTFLIVLGPLGALARPGNTGETPAGIRIPPFPTTLHTFSTLSEPSPEAVRASVTDASPKR